MQLTNAVKLYLTSSQKKLVLCAMKSYIDAVNGLVDNFISNDLDNKAMGKFSSANVDANLPSAIRGQCARDARSIVKKYCKELSKVEYKNKKLEEKGSSLKLENPTIPVVRKLCCYINNQNFKFNDSNLEFPMMIDGKCQRISVATRITDKQKEVFANKKLGTMRLVIKGKNIVAQISHEEDEPLVLTSGNIMGVDLGIKCPAVSKCSDGSVKFYGNGRQNKYMRRQMAYRRKQLQKAKKPKVVKRIKNKEQRIMRDIDHKISRQIVNHAIEHNVGTIRLEQLQNVRSATRTSRKNNHSLHNWSFYRLAKYIEYKAALAGIIVEYVNPAYTSQTCPICGKKNHATDRDYVCDCGFHVHRDILGAMNICNSTECVGYRRIA